MQQSGVLRHPWLFRYGLPLLAVMVLVGVLPLPYAYYTLMRWLVFFVAGVAVVEYVNAGLTGDNSPWLFLVAIALLWNPVLPVYLSKPLWVVLDVVAAALLFAVSVQERKRLAATDAAENHG